VQIGAGSQAQADNRRAHTRLIHQGHQLQQPGILAIAQQDGAGSAASTKHQLGVGAALQAHFAQQGRALDMVVFQLSRFRVRPEARHQQAGQRVGGRGGGINATQDKVNGVFGQRMHARRDVDLFAADRVFAVFKGLCDGGDSRQVAARLRFGGTEARVPVVVLKLAQVRCFLRCGTVQLQQFDGRKIEAAVGHERRIGAHEHFLDGLPDQRWQGRLLRFAVVAQYLNPLILIALPKPVELFGDLDCAVFQQAALLPVGGLIGFAQLISERSGALQQGIVVGTVLVVERRPSEKSLVGFMQFPQKKAKLTQADFISRHRFS
jgi:hypothetical protein